MVDRNAVVMLYLGNLGIYIPRLELQPGWAVRDWGNNLKLMSRKLSKMQHPLFYEYSKVRLELIGEEGGIGEDAHYICFKLKVISCKL